MSELTEVGGRLYFAVGRGSGLWTSDGTPEGTTLVKDILPGAEWAPPSGLTGAGGTLYLSADDGRHGKELWKSDGTPDGTTLVRDIRVGRRDGLAFDSRLAPDGMVELYFAADRGALYFAADDGKHGVELWKSDGTRRGTRLVKDVRKGRKSWFPSDLTESGGSLFFAGFTDEPGVGLWRTDGTPAGTIAIKHFPGSRDETYLTSLVDVGGMLYFVATDQPHGSEVWRSDGSAAGTTLIKEIGPGPLGFVRGLTPVGDVVYFGADDGQHGSELWRTDGTADGTILVADILPGPEASDPSRVVEAAGALFFGAVDVPRVPEVDVIEHLWRTDGSAAGTSLVSDVILTGDGCMEPAMASFGGTLYFAADDGVHGSELWRSDGTPAGTALLADLLPGSDGSFPYDLTVADDKLFLLAGGGTQLWRTDGTAEGTILLKRTRSRPPPR